MITLNCPDCGKKYELDDDMAGRKAACSCGAVLFVPKIADAPEGKKICPTCSAVTDEESLICVSCGYNYDTGGRMRSAETRVEEEDDHKLVLLRRLWKPVMLLVVIILIGIIVYNSFFAKHYGISSENPIGTLSAIEEHLKASGYEKMDPSKDALPEIFGKDAKKIEWKDVKLENQSQRMFIEKVFIIVSPENEVIALGANFKGGVKTIPGDTGSRSGRFMSSFWKDADFTFPPEYKSVTKGEGKWASSYERARSTVNDIRAEWIEYPSDISIIPSSHTMIITYSRFPEVTYGDVMEKRFEEFDMDDFREKLKERMKKKDSSNHESNESSE